VKRLLSPDLWVGVFSCMGVVGVPAALLGQWLNRPNLKTTGLFLIAPIILSGVAIICIVVPILVISNRRRDK
jgi:hypothetical protein